MFWSNNGMYVHRLYTAAFGYDFARIPESIGPAIIVWTSISILWAAWDPTYATKKRDELQGRPVRQIGKQKYNVGRSAPLSPALPDLHTFRCSNLLLGYQELSLRYCSHSLAIALSNATCSFTSQPHRFHAYTALCYFSLNVL